MPFGGWRRLFFTGGFQYHDIGKQRQRALFVQRRAHDRNPRFARHPGGIDRAFGASGLHGTDQHGLFRLRSTGSAKAFVVYEQRRYVGIGANAEHRCRRILERCRKVGRRTASDKHHPRKRARGKQFDEIPGVRFPVRQNVTEQSGLLGNLFNHVCIVGYASHRFTFRLNRFLLSIHFISPLLRLTAAFHWLAAQCACKIRILVYYSLGMHLGIQTKIHTCPCRQGGASKEVRPGERTWRNNGRKYLWQSFL